MALLEDESKLDLDPINDEEDPQKKEVEIAVEESGEKATEKPEKEKPEPVKIEPVSLDKLTRMVEFSFYTEMTVLALAILCIWGVANVTNPLNIFLGVAIFADGLANGPTYISSNILGLLYFILIASYLVICLAEMYVRRRLKNEKNSVDRKLTYRNYLVTFGLALIFILSVITAITAPM